MTFLGVDLGALSHLNQLDDVGMVEPGQCVDLSLNQFAKGSVLLEDLDGVALVTVILGELDLAADSTAQLTAQGILFQFGWHLAYAFCFCPKLLSN